MGVDWERLVRCSNAESALREIARGAARAVFLDLVLETGGPSDATVTRDSAAANGKRIEMPVGGEPSWRLVARVGEGDARDVRSALEAAASALESWRATRACFARSEARLEARTRELDLIQELGRVAAESRTPEELFPAAAAVLQGAGAVDLVLFAHALAGAHEVRAFLARPVSEVDLRPLARRAGEALGWGDAVRPRLRVEGVDAFDREGGRRGATREGDLVCLPLLRRGRVVAVLAVLPAATAGEGTLRRLYGASNHLSLHLDRILTVREAEKGRFRSILDSMPQAVILADRSLRLIQTNPAADRLLARHGLAADGITMERIGDLDLRPLAAAATGGRAPEAVGEARPEGAVLSVTVSPLSGGSGVAEGLVVVVADVTESRRMQERLAQSEKLSSLGEMISGIAHELNNPLASVLGYAQLVHASASDGKLAGRLEVIHDEALRCQRIVQNLLSFARRHEPERKLLSLNEVAEAVLSLVAYQFQVDGVRVDTDLSRELPPIHGDVHQLKQAVLNLVTNAHHALRSRGHGGRLAVRTAAESPGWVSLEVEDDGPGIPESIRSRIFDPFFTTKASGVGTGLGLSLVYGTVVSHGGSIRVDSSEGRGARFQVELPVGVPVFEDEAPETTSAATSGSSPAGRILVVDDEELVARLICEALREDGHDATAAGDGREALGRLASEEYDLVISDLRMPGIGGEDLGEEMERLRPGLSRRLLLTTGDTVSGTSDAVAARTGLPVLHKPFDLEDLRRTVRSWLAAHRERGERGPCGT